MIIIVLRFLLIKYALAAGVIKKDITKIAPTASKATTVVNDVRVINP